MSTGVKLRRGVGEKCKGWVVGGGRSNRSERVLAGGTMSPTY